MKDSKRIGAARALVLGIVAAVGLACAVVSPAHGEAVLKWRSGGEVPVAKMERAALAGALGEFVPGARQGEAKRRFVASFDRPISDEERALLQAAGVQLLNFVGGNSYFASVSPQGADIALAASLDVFRAVTPIERDWKLHPDLNEGLVHGWSIVEEPKDKGAGEHAARVAVYALFHPDSGLDAEGIPLALKHGADIVSVLDTINGLVLEMPYDSVKAFAAEDAVMWVEPPLPLFSELNAENRVITGVNTVQAPPYNLTGAGVMVFVYDGGRSRTTHVDFQGRALNIDAASVSDHATHVSGTIGGAGIANPNHRGMAPGVSIVNAGFQWGGGNGFLYTDPGDLQADYQLAILTHGATIANNSIGNNTEPNGFPCSWQGDYGATDVLIDSIARGDAFGSPMRIVWAAGNERQGTRCNVEGFGSYYSSAPPANAKNHITVGALNANNDSMTSFSSWGPSDDGRMRPDISGPGCQTGGDGGVTSTSSSSDTAYSVKCGTSMSSPTVCGIGALIIEDFRAHYTGQPDPRGSTLKTILMHTCHDILNPGPDYQSGYGSVRAVPAIELVRSGNFLEGEVGQGGVYRAKVIVAPGDPQMKVTIAWDDVPATPNASVTLINDLDLVVYSPGGVQHFPWTLDPLIPSANAVRTQRNFRDNNEQVLVDNPQPGTWLVEVRGFNVPEGPQPFSLAASPFLVNCASQGRAAFNRQRYSCSGAMTLRVIDCDLDLDDTVIDTVMVHVSSTSDPVGFGVLLTETAEPSASFTGVVQLSASPSPGQLLVAHGDTVTLVYQDADDGNGQPATVTATAQVDCTAPMISGVGVTNLQPRSATVVFTTDEPAVGTVTYSTSCGSSGTMVSGAAAVTSHAINLTGLTDDTTYFFEVSAVDDVGNAATDDNGGACYSFMTPEVPDYFTEHFLGGADPFDLQNTSITFFPNGTFEGYTACSEPIVILPIDPTAGQNITSILGDDSPSYQIVIGGGQTVKLYGVSYGTIWVNPNGHLTFLASNSTFTETLTAHFSVPRVSALFDDLNPRQGGTVTWQQLSDRIVISFVGVPQYNTPGDSNTFQYEMHFDGTIRLSWLACGSQDSIVGLSRGTGIPVDFFESDLSTYGSCGPRPPVASGGSVSTPVGTLIPIVLSGTDDGLPDPPAQVRFIIMSLPQEGRLYDPNSGQIMSVPYELVGNGNIVDFDPNCRFQGNDQFTFKVNDYGVAPEGGDSNTATVTITIGGPSVVHEFLVDDSNPGWATQGQWAFGQPTGGGGSGGGGSGNPDPSSGFTGLNVYGYNLSGNYTNNMPMYALTSHAIDCSGVSGVRVEFQRWLGVESSTYDQASFQVSNNGTTWTTVWQHSGASLNPTGWTLHSYDISAVADNQPTVYLRWTLGPTDSSVVYCGWNIDDIRIRALVPLPPCPNDLNGDCVVSFGDISHALSNWGVYNFQTISDILANWGASCR